MKCTPSCGHAHSHPFTPCAGLSHLVFSGGDGLSAGLALWIRASRHDNDGKRAEASLGQSSLPPAGRSRDGYCRSARPPELRTPACHPQGPALLSWPFSWPSYTNSSLCSFHWQQPNGENPSIPARKAQAFHSWGRNRAPRVARTGGISCPGAPVAVLRPNPGSAAKTAVTGARVAGVPPSPVKARRGLLRGPQQVGGQAVVSRPAFLFSPRVPSGHGSQPLFSCGLCVLDKFTS